MINIHCALHITLYLEVTEELVFVRKLHTHERKQLVSILQRLPSKKWECKTIAPPDTIEKETESRMLPPLPVAKLSQTGCFCWNNILLKTENCKLETGI